MRFWHGQVIAAKVKERNGFEKNRPLIILNPDDQIAPDLPLICAAVSTRFKLPLKRNEIALPWAQYGRGVASGLWEPCVAVLNWICHIEEKDVRRIMGQLPSQTMRSIQQRLAELEADGG